MKFEQALRAMRRGETVRREGWKFGLQIDDGDFAWPGECSGGRAELEHSDILATDWVIVRKKKRPDKSAPKVERDVFKDPRVGDVVGLEDHTHTVKYRNGDFVAFWSSAGFYNADSRAIFAGRANQGYRLIHRAESK